jgi:hypothetical protein
MVFQQNVDFFGGDAVKDGPGTLVRTSSCLKQQCFSYKATGSRVRTSDGCWARLDSTRGVICRDAPLQHPKAGHTRRAAIFGKTRSREQRTDVGNVVL